MHMSIMGCTHKSGYIDDFTETIIHSLYLIKVFYYVHSFRLD